MIESYDEEFVLNLCQTFKCSINKDLEDFIADKRKAISFEKRSITKTYLYLSLDKEIVAYFSISLNILKTNTLSKSIIKKIDGIDKNRKEIACFLIAQLGKSDKCVYNIGSYILSDSIDTIKEASNIIGGRVIVLDAINHPKVIDFYEKNYFITLNTSLTSKSVKMYYPLYL